MGGKNSVKKTNKVQSVIDVMQEITNETVMKVCQESDITSVLTQSIVIKGTCDESKLESKVKSCYDAQAKLPNRDLKCADVAYCTVISDSDLKNDGTVIAVNTSKLDSSIISKLKSEMETKTEQKFSNVKDSVGAALESGVKMVGDVLTAALQPFGKKNEESTTEMDQRQSIKSVMKNSMTAEFVNTVKTLLELHQSIDISGAGGVKIERSRLTNEGLVKAINDAFLTTAVGQDLSATMKTAAEMDNKSQSKGLTDIVDTVGGVINNTVSTVGGVMKSGLMAWVIIIVVFLLVVLGMWYILGNSEGLQDLASKGINKA
jgi:hypothetical protein